MSSNRRVSPDTRRQDPDDVLDWEWDWSTWLAEADDDTIDSHQVLIDDDSDTPLEVDTDAGGSSNDDTTVTVWLSGGTAGTLVPVTVRITTADGRTADGTVTFHITEL